MQNERGEYVTIGEIEELPPAAGNFKSSYAQFNPKSGPQDYNIAEKIKAHEDEDRFGYKNKHQLSSPKAIGLD